MRINLLLLGDAAPDLAVIALVAIAATLFVHCNLIRQRWFLNVLAVAAAAHLAVVMMFPGMDLGPTQFRLIAALDVLALIGLVFCIEKMLSLRKPAWATTFASPGMGSRFAFDLVPARATRQAMIPPRAARG